jgi:hypothetical protein
MNVSDLCSKLGLGIYAVSYSIKALRYTISKADDGTWWLTKEGPIELVACEQYADYPSASDAAAEYLASHEAKGSN